MRAPFEPIGDRPQWQMVYDAMSDLDIGDVLTYQSIAEALGADKFNPNHRAPFYKAANVWGEEHSRAFMAVQRVGYRVVEPAEHEVMARDKHKRSRRQLRKGLEVIHRADRSKLPPDVVARFDSLEHTISRHADALRTLRTRQQRSETAIAASRQEIAVTAERVAALEDALRRNGITE